MLSILIPVYNYNITCLVEEIHKQATNAKVVFEIICLDDCSKKYLNENKSCIESLDYTSIIVSKVNYGRTKSRQILSDNANYNWLLFLDADVMPKSNYFILNYLDKTNLNYSAFYGGFAYKESRPNSNKLLRWKYGRKFEQIDAKKRNINPYQINISGNFLIKKNTFDAINSKVERKSYGLDNYFSALLKEEKTKILHTNNEVYHLGIEKNDTYLQKIRLSIKTLLWIHHEKKIETENKLLKYFTFFCKLKLDNILVFIYKKFNHRFEKNLLGKNPNIFLLQFYKIICICFYNFEQKNKLY